MSVSYVWTVSRGHGMGQALLPNDAHRALTKRNGLVARPAPAGEAEQSSDARNECRHSARFRERRDAEPDIGPSVDRSRADRGFPRGRVGCVLIPRPAADHARPGVLAPDRLGPFSDVSTLVERPVGARRTRV